jgi:hypothetical protein
MNTTKSLQDDRQVRADDIFERISLPGTVEDHEGWDSWSCLGTEQRNNIWSKVCYFQSANPEDEDTVKKVFEVTFRANSCVPIDASLDGVSLPLPR